LAQVQQDFYSHKHSGEKPKLKVAILERGKEVLTKVRISGGGRQCHHVLCPNDLVKFYPRGEKNFADLFINSEIHRMV
jgi:predicted flavoprotein YhiN